jgi:ribokinase
VATLEPGVTPEYLAFSEIGVDVAVRIQHLPAADEKIGVRPVGEYPGGMAANAACAFAALGGRAGVVSTIGRDDHATLALADLAARGVSTRWVHAVDEPTFWTLALLSDDGNKSLLEFPMPSPGAKYEHFDASALDGVAFIHVVADEGESALGVMSEARSRGITTALDLETPGLDVPCLGRLLGQTDILFINAAAARAFGTDPAAAIVALHELGPSTVLLTRGGAGCLLSEPAGHLSELPAHRVTAVDATGAGDCFAGAFAYGRTRGWPDAESAQLANLMAALSTTALGSRGHLATLTELGVLARENGLSVGARLP